MDIDQFFRAPDSNINIGDIAINDDDSEEISGAIIPPLHPRVEFIRKLYGLMFVSIFLVISSSSYMIYSMQTQLFKNFAFLLIIFALVIGTMFFVFCKRSSLKNPFKNFLTFFLFYLQLMILFSTMISLNDFPIVLMIFINIDAIMFSLTIYTLITQNLITFQVATLFVLCPIFVNFNIFLIFSSILLEYMIFVSMAGVIWGFYIIYETQRIMKTKSFDKRQIDIFIEAITIYVDIFFLLLRNAELLKETFITKRSKKINKKDFPYMSEVAN